MLLNMDIVADLLEGQDIVSRAYVPHVACTLAEPVLWKAGQTLSPDKLYIVRGKSFSMDTGHISRIHLVSCGEPVNISNPALCDVIVLKDDISVSDALSSVQDVFTRCNQAERKLLQAFLRDEDPAIFGSILGRFLNAPVMLSDENFDFVFNWYDETDPQSSALYSRYDEPDYTLDELRIILNTDEYKQALGQREPYLFNPGMYESNYICLNIFEGDVKTGHFVIGGDYRPLRESDYALAQAFQEILSALCKRHRTPRDYVSWEFENMVVALIDERRSYQHDFDTILAERNWQRFDRYLVVCIYPREKTGSMETALLGKVFPVERRYLFDLDGHAVVLANIDGSISLPELESKIDEFARTTRNDCVSSMAGSDFADLACLYDQAVAASACIDRSNPPHHTGYRSLARSVVIKTCLEAHPPDFFINPNMRLLIERDKAKSGELVSTLRSYLRCGLNIASCIAELHIQRGTFTYRKKRIEEILGVSLADNATRTYLQFQLDLLDFEGGNTELRGDVPAPQTTSTTR